MEKMKMATQPNYAELYAKLRATPAAHLTDQLLNEIFNRPEVKSQQGSLSREQIKTTTRIAHRVALSVDETEFTDFMVTGDVPAIKLNPKEMELLKGGIDLNNLRFIATIVLSAISL
jgi:hypothetical protein